MKKLSILSLTLIFILSFSVFFALAQSNTAEQIPNNNFKPNKALSDYLDAQGFKVGISRSEAISYYKLDKTGVAGGSAAYKYWRSDMVDTLLYPIKVGFYEGKFHNDHGQLTNSLYGISKCIAIEKERINEMAIKEAFGKKYDIKLEPHAGLRLNHHGRYIEFHLQVIELKKGKYMSEFAGSAVVISLQDNTEELQEKAKSEKGVDNATERVKKQMF